MTRHRFAFPFLFILALALLPATTQAQDMTRFWEFTPKAGNTPAFVEAFRAHVEYRKELGDPWSWYVYETVVGKDFGKFYVASWNHTWADFDAYDQWENGAAASAHFQATVSPLVEEMTTNISQSNRQMERMPADPNWVPGFVNVTTFFINPAKQGQFNEMIMKWHEAIEAADMDVYYASDFLAAGGEGPLFSIAIMGDNWASFAEPDPTMEQVMVAHFGEEEAMEIFTSFGESYHYYDNMIVRPRPDLSLIHGGM
jgi:hypothetical protein